jgi:tetratricopeptide (TPR) repeat protein
MSIAPLSLAGALAALALLLVGCPAGPTPVPPAATPIAPAATPLLPVASAIAPTETALPDEVYVERAREALASGAYDAAIADLDRAIAGYPVDAEAYLLRGQAYEGKGDLEAAIANFSQACPLAGQPGDALTELCADALSRRALVYCSSGDPERALADAEQAIKLDPGYAEGYNARGCAYQHQGKYDDAIAAFTRAIELEPSGAYYCNRGNADSLKGERDAAITDWTEAIRLDPDDWQAYGNRGGAYFDMGDFDRALAD